MNLSYYKDASEIKERDEWFFIETKYFKYSEYQKIETLKSIEWSRYVENKISYKELKYPKNIFEYLEEVQKWRVWELLIVKNKVITNETRDKVAFELFIPAGAALINPHLDTSVKKSISWNDIYFSKKEHRKDRLFAYKEILYPWIYNFTYLMRLTHSGKYSIKPTRVSEFYNVGNRWKTFQIEELF